MSDPKIDSLARVPLFARCTRKELEFLATRTDEVTVEAGRTLITQGTPADTFYLLLDGGASVQVNGRDRPALNSGSFFWLTKSPRASPPRLRGIHRVQL